MRGTVSELFRKVFRGFQRFLEVFRSFQRFSEVFQRPLRDPLRVFPLVITELRVLPLIVLFSHGRTSVFWCLRARSPLAHQQPSGTVTGCLRAEVEAALLFHALLRVKGGALLLSIRHVTFLTHAPRRARPH